MRGAEVERGLAPSAPLTDGVGSVLDREVYFSLAGYAGPGFHNWPQSHIPQDTAPNSLLRSRPHAKKTFGEAFGAATGVSDPRLQKIQIRNDYPGKITSVSSTDPTPSVSGPVEAGGPQV